MEVEKNTLVMIEYSPKALAVFGDTKPHKEALKEAGGTFNSRLRRNGGTAAGWIYSKAKREDSLIATLQKLEKSGVKVIYS